MFFKRNNKIQHTKTIVPYEQHQLFLKGNNKNINTKNCCSLRGIAAIP